MPLYVVELTAYAPVRQIRVIDAKDKADAEDMARETVRDHVWTYEGILDEDDQDDSIEVVSVTEA